MESDIRSLDNLKQLGALKALQELDFTNCPVTQTPNYRPVLFDSYLFLHSASKVSKYSTSTTSTASSFLIRRKNLTSLNTTRTRTVQMRMTTRRKSKKTAMLNLARKNDGFV
jgi:hypothetical protein